MLGIKCNPECTSFTMNKLNQTYYLFAGVVSLLHYISSHSHIFESSGSVRVWESFLVKKKNRIKYASGKMLKTGDKVFWEYVFPTFSFITFRQFIALKDTFKVMNIRNCFLLYILHISFTRVYIQVYIKNSIVFVACSM